MRRIIVIFAVLAILIIFMSRPQHILYETIAKDTDNEQSDEIEETSETETVNEIKLNKYYGAEHKYEDTYESLPLGCHVILYYGKTQVILMFYTPLYLVSMMNEMVESGEEVEVHAIARLDEPEQVEQRSKLLDDGRTMIVLTVHQETVAEEPISDHQRLYYAGSVCRMEIAYNINDKIYYADYLAGGQNEWIMQVRANEQLVVVFMHIPYTVTDRRDDFDIK